ncbi:Mn2+ homeostasis protein-like protein Per1 [Microthyrium microscopicum]|uniref:Post-GPI attachment to proteins factor 3 n=1 Tax=Microthyrium microscopicum TaxID=703497 RepID=A0A6A6UQY9_9PEZI|nr:Mn2+ homeostasis protein-like protein Per1 [Microthyrium microscopicum]
MRPLEARRRHWAALLLSIVLLQAVPAQASLGDRLPDFKECVKVCIKTNCDSSNPTPIPLQRRLLLWNCPAECDYHCQHVVTDKRLARDPPYREPILQFHGKWPFHRFLGMQEPFSVLFSLLNFLAHDAGIRRLKDQVPASYELRKYYLLFGYFGLVTWTFSMLFHTRDFALTEKLDYFAAGASVLYGLYYCPIRIFRLEESTPSKSALLRAWTLICVALYIAHVSYLSFWTWDYTYNMAANIAVGVTANVMWSWFSVYRFQRTKKWWSAWPGMIVAWVVLAMSMELFDFAPWGGMIDAHSLWHLGTVVPTIWWYSFLVKDAKDDIQGTRLKQ